MYVVLCLDHNSPCTSIWCDRPMHSMLPTHRRSAANILDSSNMPTTSTRSVIGVGWRRPSHAVTTLAPSVAPPRASDHRRLYCIATDRPVAGDRVFNGTGDPGEAEPATAQAAADSLGMPPPHVGVCASAIIACARLHCSSWWLIVSER